MSLILASNSSIRRAMLKQAGVVFAVQPPEYDEKPVQLAHRGDSASLALKLAEGKALSVATNHDDWVIGSDSVVELGGQRYSKPRNREEAIAHLRAFSGQEMTLSSAVALARANRVNWSQADTALLSVRPLSDAFIQSYLDAEWPEVGYCVGVFRMEGRGVQLFDDIRGSYFTILGMPLLPLLGALRSRGILPS